ncbi:hypothetical protein RJP21_27380 [Paenibacillus sp. VCA1]|uniref:hypothetical protein n=1 Tax=Paenibacillus sp. VCA1 TaxID=3039148 RepID=UPI0028713872|nr:hypothetical protein [Paenibacillus sp. VCA1]MDR9857323.1 hypothetical protein [Paenibacillus sp. VCA1]
MSFILIEHEKRPIKLRGKKVIPSTISVFNKDTLEDGEYVGVRSHQRVILINHGGSLIAAPELRDVYKISNMIPATLNEEAVQIECDEIFVKINDLSKVKRYSFKEYTVTDIWKDTFSLYWIPCSFSVENTIGYGWLRVSTKEIILTEGFIPMQSNNIQVNLLLSFEGSKSEVTLNNLEEIDF